MDPSFGTGGKTRISVGTGANLQGMAVQADGSIVAVGYVNTGSQNSVALVRLTVAGALDTTFGTAGIVTTNIAATDDRGMAVAVQSDGKIVVAGHSVNGGGDRDFFVARYDSTGVLDGGYGTAGITITDLNAASEDLVTDLRLDASGNAVVVGTSAGTSLALVRYDTAGAPDAGFNGTGIQLSAFTGPLDVANCLHLQADGYLVVGGYTGGSGSEDSNIARYDTTGTLDPLFNGTGNLTTTVDAATDQIWDLRQQSDGSFLWVGEYPGSSGTQLALGKVLSSGVTDTSFGTAGVLKTTHGTSSRFRRLQLDSAGRAVLAGDLNTGVENHFGVARYLASGALDTSFGEQGLFEISFEAGAHAASSILVGSSGILVGGTVPDGATTGFGIVQIVP